LDWGSWNEGFLNFEFLEIFYFYFYNFLLIFDKLRAYLGTFRNYATFLKYFENFEKNVPFKKIPNLKFFPGKFLIFLKFSKLIL
jgi:hypothetical protein